MNESYGIASTEVGTDAILGGRLTLRQFRRGHRVGTDAVLLAAAARTEAGDVLVDVGAGVGTIGLALALRTEGLTARLLEADAAVAALAAENCRLNAVEARVSVACCDLFDPAARRAARIENGRATIVVTNPPFHEGREVRASADPRKARAHSLGETERSFGHGDWCRAALSLLAPGGRFHAIHRPQALPALLAACEGRLGNVAIMPIHAKPGDPAIRILLAGVKGSRAPMRLRFPLILHGPGGEFTPETEALHRGEAVLTM